MNRVTFAKEVFFIIEKFMKAMCKSFRHNFLYFSKLLDCWYKVTYICEHCGQKDATIFKFRLLYNQKKTINCIINDNEISPVCLRAEISWDSELLAPHNKPLMSSISSMWSPQGDTYLIVLLLSLLFVHLSIRSFVAMLNWLLRWHWMTQGEIW